MGYIQPADTSDFPPLVWPNPQRVSWKSSSGGGLQSLPQSLLDSANGMYSHRSVPRASFPKQYTFIPIPKSFSRATDLLSSKLPGTQAQICMDSYLLHPCGYWWHLSGLVLPGRNLASFCRAWNSRPYQRLGWRLPPLNLVSPTSLSCS